MIKITDKFLIFTIILVMHLITGCEKQKKSTAPLITTNSISNITSISAVSGGNITSDGGETVTTRGVCWSTGITPTILDSKTTDAAGAGSFSSNITGIFGGTIYYVRAYATNSIGTGYGMALSFTTTGEPPSAPTTSATNATQIQSNSATLNGTVNAKYYSTTVAFEYGTTVSYGQTLTSTPSSITGGTNIDVSASLTGLTVGTTYHYRIKAVNSLGTTNSNDITFTTLGQAPTATTQTATVITTTSATLNGSVNAHDLSTVVTFEYGTSTSYVSSITATQSPITGNTSKPVSVVLAGLSPNITYHFRVKTVNPVGTNYGNDVTFTTLGNSPTTSTQTPSNISTTSAGLNGMVNANSLSTTVTFEYGITISYGQSISATQSPVTGSSSISVNANVLSLSPNTTYHYRVKAVNTLGTAYGDDVSFTTLGQSPTVSILAATNVQPFSSTLNGTINANYLSTTVNFEYGTTTSYGSTATATQSPLIGNANTIVSVPITGLIEGTTYHYRIVAINTLGTTNSNDMSFTTLGQVPIVITLAATKITSVAAQLNGTANANYLSTIVTFEYGTTISYGSSITTIQSPLTGNTNTNLSSNITGLILGTTYHFRVKAVNSLGTTYGNDMTFTAVYAIGENVNGGIVFYIDGTGQHGLVCAPTDQATGTTWGCSGTLIAGADGTAVGTGNQNTIDIVNHCSTAGIAARICYDLVLNTYSDWFLPSIDELSLMYTNLQANGLGGFAIQGNYWSSSEVISTEAWRLYISSGASSYAIKDGSLYVRAVRAF